MANVRFYNDLRLLQKRANQAMVRLERLGIQSPAYQAAQAKLEVLGKRTQGNRGRRFSETGKATYNEYEYQKRILEDFLGMSTRTQQGAKQWVEDVWQGALKSDKDLKLQEAGVTRDEWLDFWSNMPSSHKDRAFGSEVIVKMLRTYSYKNKEMRDEQKLSMAEIAEAIQNSSSVKSAYKSLGINYKDVKEVNSLGAL